jgi:AbrB family looped-hinge helix DNA binding protein
MSTATLTSKGQITVPKEVRDALHLEPGTKLQFRVTKDREIVMRPRNWDVSKLKGIVKPPPGVHATIEEIEETIERGL